jgi:hypothetical protein
MSDSIIVTQTAKIWLGEDGIIRIVSRKTAPGTIADSMELWHAVKTAGGGITRPLFADIRNTSLIDSESRKYFARTETRELISAVALLVESPFSRVIGSLFLGINRLPVPIRLFTLENQAMEWLQSQTLMEKKT